MWFSDWFKKRPDPSPRPEPKLLRVLVLCLMLEDQLVLERLGKQHGWELTFANTQEGFRLLARNPFAVILFDRNQRVDPWREVLDRLVKAAPGSSILLVSPANDDYLWREVLQHGGYGLVSRPLRAEPALHAIQAAAHFVSPATRSSS